MALYLKRVETVVSLQQLSPDGGASAAPTTPGGGAAELAPDAPVSAIGASRLPTYHYATHAAPGRVSRIGSLSDCWGRVPDVDECSDDASGELTACDAGGLDQVMTAAAGSNGTSKHSGVPPSRAALAALAAAGGSSANGGLAPLVCGDEGGSSCEGSTLDAGCVPSRSLLDTVLLAMWEERAEAGLFRYDVTACPTKVLPGQYGFVAQLNEGRYSKKRPTEFRVDAVVQPFDGAKFNFTKAFKREVLFAFEPAPPGAGSCFSEAARAVPSPDLVLINVSPIEYGHVLLCPDVLACTPQLLGPAGLRSALHFALEVANPWLRVGFNSLGAFATINHLHFQAYYLAAPLPCERAPTARLGGPVGDAAAAAGVAISRLLDYPVAGWVVEGPSLGAMAQFVGDAALAMQAANIPHNVLIADCGGRVFVFPQAYAERQARGEVPEALLEVGVNPAVWEISGHLVLKRAADYEAFSEAAAWELLAAVSLSEAELDGVAARVFAAPSGGARKAARADADGDMAMASAAACAGGN